MNNHPDQIFETNKAVAFEENQRQIKFIHKLVIIVLVSTLFVFLTLVLYPILASRENSFTLAIDRLEQRDEKAKLIKPSYVDVDRNNNPVNISAESAYREENEHTDYYFTNLVAHMSLPTGDAIEILANSGSLNTGNQIMDLGGEIVITSETGFLLRSTEAKFLIGDKVATGRHGVTGIAPFGKFSAENFDANVESETIILNGNVKINFDPNKPLNIFNSSVNNTDEGINN